MIPVTCAIIRNEDNEVLVVQRGEETDHPYKWEFPGGKLRKGETEEECIIREISEELSMDIIICTRQDPVEHDYGKKKIRLIPFVCDTLDELPVLAEHIAYRWVTHEALGYVDLCEADVTVASDYLESVEDKSVVRDEESDNEESPAVEKDLQSMINSMMSMQEAEWLAASAGENPVLFRKLFDYSFSPEKKLAFRASWTLSKVTDRYPDLIHPYLTKITESLNGIENEAVQRSFLRILSFTDLRLLDQKQHGVLADHCFSTLNSGFSAIAVKAYSMEIIYGLALIYPELAHELAASISILQEDGPAGVVARGRIILKKLSEENAGESRAD